MELSRNHIEPHSTTQHYTTQNLATFYTAVGGRRSTLKFQKYSTKIIGLDELKDHRISVCTHDISYSGILETNNTDKIFKSVLYFKSVTNITSPIQSIWELRCHIGTLSYRTVISCSFVSRLISSFYDIILTQYSPVQSSTVRNTFIAELEHLSFTLLQHL